MTKAQRFAQIFGAVYLLVGIEISFWLHRYLRKPHPFGFYWGSPLHRVRALLVHRRLTAQHYPRRDRDRGTRRLLKSHRGERAHSRTRGGSPEAFQTTRPLYRRRFRRSPATNGVGRRLVHRHFPDHIRSLLRLAAIPRERPHRKLRSPDDPALRPPRSPGSRLLYSWEARP